MPFLPLTSRLGAVATVAALAFGTLAVAVPASAAPAAAPEAAPPAARIVGGQVADPTDYKDFLVSLQIRFPGDKKWSHLCGGSVITPSTVLTAGHCTPAFLISDDYPEIEYRIVFGATKLPNGAAGDTVQTRSIVGGKVHAKFANGKKVGFDATLLELDAPLKGAKPVNLPTPGTDALVKAGSTATVYGWGLTKSSTTTVKKARTVDVPILSKDECRIAGVDDGPLAFNPKSDICAGIAGKAVAGGDSGGPLVKKIGKKVYQIGIVSRAHDHEGAAGQPDIYTYTGAAGMWKGFLDEVRF